MPTDPEAIRADYVAITPALEELCDELKLWLISSMQVLGLHTARVSGRVKGLHSFLGKLVLKERLGEPYENPLTDTSDKVGLRVDVVYLQDVLRVVDHIQSEGPFDSAAVDDKDDDLGLDRLGYRGVHVDVVPSSVPQGLTKEQAKCEIQIRTNAQSAWAMAVHPLQHKPPVELPDDLKRNNFRLTALIELFDEGVQRALDHMTGLDGYPLAIIEQSLERARMEFTAIPFQPDLTRHILVDLEAVPDDAEAARQLAENLIGFVKDNFQKLETVYGQHLPGADPILLAQPEAILIFYLLDQDKFLLYERWDDIELPDKYLTGLADVWGANLPG